MKSDKQAIFNLAMVVCAIIEELENEGSPLSSLLIEYKKDMQPYYDKVRKE